MSPAVQVSDDEIAAALAACLIYLAESEPEGASAQLPAWARAGRLEAMGINPRVVAFDRGWRAC